MRLLLPLLLFLFLLTTVDLRAQETLTLDYQSHVTIPNDLEISGSPVGGLSAIAYNTDDGFYYFAADKPPARLFVAKISSDDNLEVDFNDVLIITPPLLSDSEFEGLVYAKVKHTFFLADEQNAGTRIMEVDKNGAFLRIIEPVNSPFLALSGHNSGIEGLTMSKSGRFLYYGYERPTEGCIEQQLTVISRVGLSSRKKEHSYYYPLHHVEGDQLGTNGISELLLYNDSTLLVMERAYIPGEGNTVRIFQVSVTDEYPDTARCHDRELALLQPQLIYDFSDNTAVKVDNAEGMCFNADKTQLFIVTDNNFSTRQETQVIVLEVRAK